MGKVKNTVEDLSSRLTKTTENLKKLRNLHEELRSKIFVENVFRRYLQYRLDRLNNQNAIK